MTTGSKDDEQAGLFVTYQEVTGTAENLCPGGVCSLPELSRCP